jgi:TldD protein
VLLAASAVGHRSSSSNSSFHRSSVLSNAVRDAGQATVDPAGVHALCQKALDAATAAGATYADVRLTRTLSERFLTGLQDRITDVQEGLALGVRAFINGYWGFAATPYWTTDEAIHAASAAAAQAKANARGPMRSVEWTPAPVVTGSWQTPVTIDPFRLSLEEKGDILFGLIETATHMLPRTTRNKARIYIGLHIAEWSRQEQALATSEGSYVTQTFHRTKMLFTFGAVGMNKSRELILSGGDEDGRGWEKFTDLTVFDQLPSLLAILDRPPLPVRTAELGRKPVVCDARTMARIMDATLGRATQVDRALGYEANAVETDGSVGGSYDYEQEGSGTSYFGPDPLNFLGKPVAHDMITVTANRSWPTGLATVQWDAEGVVPEDFTLIKTGTLVDYQTTREQAAWLAPWYNKAGITPRSRGCAAAQDALYPTMQMTPNLALAPAASGGGVEDFVSGMSDGFLVEGCHVWMDFQGKSGAIRDWGPGEPRVYQIKGGKRVAILKNACILFNTSDLWKNITALGGPQSVQYVASSEMKGDPGQVTRHTLSAPPGVFKELPMIDGTRKA